MKDIKGNIKEKVKAKAKDVKENLKSKLKGAKKLTEATALGLIASLYGCMDTNPASRANSNAVGDVRPTVKVVIGENAVSNAVAVTVTTTFGDGVLASADSAGSTETQTATPTLDVRTRVDARYNDALKNASDASKDVLSQLTSAGANEVLELMASKGTGTVEVAKKDGTTATVECKDGQCAFKGACSGGACEDKD